MQRHGGSVYPLRSRGAAGRRGESLPLDVCRTSLTMQGQMKESRFNAFQAFCADKKASQAVAMTSKQAEEKRRTVEWVE